MPQCTAVCIADITISNLAIILILMPVIIAKSDCHFHDSKCGEMSGHCSAAGFVVNQVSCGILGDVSDLIFSPGVSSSISSVGVRGDKHSLESEVDVEEVQGILDLLNLLVNVNNFLGNGEACILDHADDSGQFSGVNAIVEDLSIASNMIAEHVKDK